MLSAQYVFVDGLLTCSLLNAGGSHNCRRIKMSLITLTFSALLSVHLNCILSVLSRPTSKVRKMGAVSESIFFIFHSAILT